ncbi:transcriptional activator of glycolytic enzymes-domain-containing protein [Lipomyces oligophaga]|uniref:transcriptional activator of glycolytic enzymes-domain-containing protein n=1 Tax=Lipomyces oligophaga TaxID=45792 RepID=UPI0034CDCCE5
MESSILIDQRSKNDKDLVENRDRMIREMANAITSDSADGDDALNASVESAPRAHIIRLNEWNIWCKDIRNFSDGAIVNEDKVCLFLRERVLARFLPTISDGPDLPSSSPNGSASQSSQAQHSTTSGLTKGDDNTPIHVVETASALEIFNVLKGYVSVLLEQYKYQRRSGFNSNPHPHGVILKALLQKYQTAASLATRMTTSRSIPGGPNNYYNPLTNGHTINNRSNNRRHSHQRSSRTSEKEFGERFSVPGLSPDLSDSELDSFSDDGIERDGVDTNGLRSNSTSQSHNRTNGNNASLTRIERMIQSTSQSLRDNMQYLLSIQTDKILLQIGCEMNDLRATVERQTREISALYAIIERLTSIRLGSSNSLAPSYDHSESVRTSRHSSLQARTNQPVVPQSQSSISSTNMNSFQHLSSRTPSQVTSPLSLAHGSTQHPPPLSTRSSSAASNNIARATSQSGFPVQTTNGNFSDSSSSGFSHQSVENPKPLSPPHNQPLQTSKGQNSVDPPFQQQQQQQSIQIVHTSNQGQAHVPGRQLQGPSPGMGLSLPLTVPASSSVTSIAENQRQNKAPSIAHQRHIQHQQDNSPYLLTPNRTNAGKNHSSTTNRSTPMTMTSSPGIPQYRMSREINTVPDLWREWEHGLHGGPSVRGLEESVGTRWRQSSAERKFFCLRKVVIDYIHMLCGREGISAEEAVSRVEDIRKLNQFNSLQKLSEFLKKMRPSAS